MKAQAPSAMASFPANRREKRQIIAEEEEGRGRVREGEREGEVVGRGKGKGCMGSGQE